ncbi:unnamed protein product, partial [Mesorhabditis spiculigera]
MGYAADHFLASDDSHKCRLSENNFRHRRFKRGLLVILFLSAAINILEVVLIFASVGPKDDSDDDPWKRLSKLAVLYAEVVFVASVLLHGLGLLAVYRKWRFVLLVYTFVMIAAWCASALDFLENERGVARLLLLPFVIYLSHKNATAIKHCPECY